MVTLIGETTEVRWVGGGSATAPVTLTVTEPDGQTSTPSVDTSGTQPTAPLTPATPGRHLLAWQDSTGDRFADILDVWPSTPRYIISVEDALAAIRLSMESAISTAQANGIEVYIAAATWVIENIVGPVLPTTRTTHADGGRPIVLPHPVSGTVTLTVGGGSAITPTAPDLDGEAGIIYTSTPAGRRNVLVEYETGSAVIPENVRLATREEVRFLWQVGQQGPRPIGESADTTPWQPEGFAVPRRVIELLQATPRFGGFA